MSLENTRVIQVALSEGQINSAFDSLLLMTGHMHDNEVITHVTVPTTSTDGVKLVEFKINKEVQASRPD